MLIQIAWRNIWRNKTRSFVVISSIIIGLWAGVFMLAFSWGMYKNNIDDTVFKQLSHIQIHHPLFKEETDSYPTQYDLKQFQISIFHRNHDVHAAGHTYLYELTFEFNSMESIYII